MWDFVTKRFVKYRIYCIRYGLRSFILTDVLLIYHSSFEQMLGEYLKVGHGRLLFILYN
jgi:hypothetical protein